MSGRILNTTKIFSIVIIYSLLISCNKNDDNVITQQNTNTASGGPFQHKVLSAVSTDGLNWIKEDGIRLEHASVPCAVSESKRIILYYVDADRGPGLPESVGCAVSTDGVNFQKQPFKIEGFTYRKTVDPSIIRDNSGKFRLYYLASNATGDPGSETSPHEIHLATSDDGINFTSYGIVFSYEGLVDPDIFFYKETWYMYVFDLVKGETIIATSSDGYSFSFKQALSLKNWGTVAPILLDNGNLRLYAFEQKKQTGNSFCSFISSNGIDWLIEDGIRLQAATGDQITDPFVIRWKDSFRMYYKINSGN
jgi:hypothetical protein